MWLTADILHYDNTPKQYTAILSGCKNGNCKLKHCDIFLTEAVQTSTHDTFFEIYCSTTHEEAFQQSEKFVCENVCLASI